MGICTYLYSILAFPRVLVPFRDWQKPANTMTAAQSKNDAWTKLHSDPLFAIRQQEINARRKITSNPVKMEAIREQIKALGYARYTTLCSCHTMPSSSLDLNFSSPVSIFFCLSLLQPTREFKEREKTPEKGSKENEKGG